MTQQQHHKALIIEQIKCFTNSERHRVAMGRYERHY